MSAPTKVFRDGLIEALPRLRRFALVLTRADADADDLLQATCERALTRWEQFTPGTRMESWLFSIMHSIFKNLARKQATRGRVHAELGLQSHYEDGDRIVSGKIAITEVLSHMNALAPDQAAALSLVGLDGLSYREAAEVLNIPQGTLESRVARGRVALGRILETRSTQGKTHSDKGHGTTGLSNGHAARGTTP